MKKPSVANIRVGLLVLATAILTVWVLVKVIWPGYTSPTNGMYSSSLGYETLVRKQGKPLPVKMAKVSTHSIQQTFLGEGLLMSEPLLVSVVPKAKIKKVHVRKGQRVTSGQLMAELDDQEIQLKLQAAVLALTTAQAELERTKVGTTYVLAQERPNVERINTESAHTEAQIQSQHLQMLTQLEQEGLISKEQVMLKSITVQRSLGDAKLSDAYLAMSEEGKKRSIVIAENTLAGQSILKAQCELELAAYTIYAPADGIVERQLIHDGEFNSDPGKPAFVVASGLWFEAHLDQSATGRIQEGGNAEVMLEAYPGHNFAGVITEVNPIVSFNLGGPEISRPIRPLGTGTPEWPATFSVRIKVDEKAGMPLVPGLTGFGRITIVRESLAVPQGAVASVSSGQGLVHVVEADGKQQVRQVLVGATSDGVTEILDGLRDGETVITEGYESLRPSDRVIDLTERGSE